MITHKLAASLIGIPLVLGSAHAAAASADKAGKNANFVGHWTVSSGVGFTVSKQNKNGTCSGKSDLAAQGYGFTHCHVSGQRYSFYVTYGSGYVSKNSGTFHGASLKGSFNDGRGPSPYTATRSKHA